MLILLVISWYICNLFYKITNYFNDNIIYKKCGVTHKDQVKNIILRERSTMTDIVLTKI